MVELLSYLSEHHPSSQARVRTTDVQTLQPQVARDALRLAKLRRGQPPVDFGIHRLTHFAGGKVLVHEGGVSVCSERRGNPFEYGPCLVQTAGHDQMSNEQAPPCQ